jgi:glycosyltransferase involved in cell wall biosynthesis
MSRLSLKIVMTAYDVNPFRGSESGTGWNFPFHIADENHHVTLITRPNNRPHIEKFLSETDPSAAAHMQFAYFDLPYWARFWKKGARGARLYFWLWQFFVVSFIRRQGLEADIYHGLNFHSDTTPSFLWRLKGRSMWGPINHNEPIPDDFLPNRMARLIERSKWITRRLIWALDPFLYLTRRNTNLILAANQSVVHRLGLKKWNKFAVVNTIAGTPMVDEVEGPPDDGMFRILCVGRFVPIKAMGFALDVFEDFFAGLSVQDRARVQLIVVGAGPLEKTLEAKAESSAACDSILIKPWVAQADLFAIYQQSDCFMNFSHEGAGAVNAEAMAASLPILCFDNFGPGEMVTSDTGRKIPLSPYPQACTQAALVLRALFDDPKGTQKLGQQAQADFIRKFSWRARADTIRAHYQKL